MKEGEADYRAFSRRVLKDDAPLGSPWRRGGLLRRSANPWNLFKKSLSGSVTCDEDHMLWSWLSGYKSWLHHLLSLWFDLEQLLNLFPYVQTWENIGLLWEINELTYGEHLEQCLLQSEVWMMLPSSRTVFFKVSLDSQRGPLAPKRLRTTCVGKAPIEMKSLEQLSWGQN